MTLKDRIKNSVVTNLAPESQVRTIMNAGAKPDDYVLIWRSYALVVKDAVEVEEELLEQA